MKKIISNFEDSLPVSYGHTAADNALISGKVKIFYEAQGFGVVTPDDGAYEIVVQSDLLRRLGIGSLQQGQRVRCTVGVDRHGRPAASDVTLV